MKLIQNLSIKSSDPEHPILLDIRYVESSSIKPLVVFSHGFKGFKDWGHWDLIANHFADNGYVFAKFNFSHNGTTSAAPEEFGDLEAFARNNYSTELQDLGFVIDYLLSSDFEGDGLVNSRKLLLIGHSRGGTVSLLKAREDNRVKGVAAWAPIYDIEQRWPEEMRRDWKEKGRIFVQNARTGQKMPLDYQMAQDYLDHRDRLDIKNTVHELEIPMLVVHGTADEAIPYEGAKQMESWSSQLQFETIEGATHAFGGTHPMKSDGLSKDASRLVEITEHFFHNNFK